MLRKIFVLASLTGLLAGCAFQNDPPAPTPYPADYLPTLVYLTARSIQATSSVQTAAAVTPTRRPTFTPSPIPITATASITPTPLPADEPGAIQITSPGSMSKVASPMEIRLRVATTKNTKVYMALYGEDGSLLADELINIPTTSSNEYVYAKFPFDIRAAAEDGYLQVTTRDSTGLLMALDTVKVLLLSNGASQITPAGNAVYERVSLETPKYQASISGGTLTIKGMYLPVNLQPVTLELIDINGKSLNANRVLVPTDLNSQVINTTIPYNIEGSTPAYLVIHQQDDVLKNPVYISTHQPEVLNGPAYIFTELITLNP
jgi:hypothetical protein